MAIISVIHWISGTAAERKEDVYWAYNLTGFNSSTAGHTPTFTTPSGGAFDIDNIPDNAWYIITIDTSDTSAGTIQLLSARSDSDTTIDRIWLVRDTAGREYDLNAQGGKDEYLIASSFSARADDDTTTDVTITDSGENIFRFRNDVQIKGLTITDNGSFEISFGGTSAALHTALTIENASSAKFKIGNAGTLELTALQFLGYLGYTANGALATPKTVSADLNTGGTIPTAPSGVTIPTPPPQITIPPETVVEPLKTVVIHGVKFTLLDPDANGTKGISLGAADIPQNLVGVSLTFSNNYHSYALRDATEYTPDALKNIWDTSDKSQDGLIPDNTPAIRNTRIVADIVDNTIMGATGAAIVAKEGSPVNFPATPDGVVLDYETSANTVLKAYGTLKITDGDGVGMVTAAPATYGTFTIAQHGDTGRWGWVYTLDPDDEQTAKLMGRAEPHTENIALTIPDMAAGTPNMTPYMLPISITVTGMPPGEDAEVTEVLSTIVIHGVRFTYISDDPLPDGLGIRIVRDVNAAILKDNAYYSIVFQNARQGDVAPSDLANRWNLGDGSDDRKDIIEAMTIEANRAGVTVEELVDLTPDGPILFKANDKAVTLNHTTLTESDLEAGGRFRITDAEGVDMVEASDPMYGDFTIEQDGETDRWDWTYTLNPHDSATRMLAAGERMEEITLTITDDETNETEYTHTITITVSGTPAAADATLITETPGADTSVAYDHDAATNENNTASGTLTITDGDGIASVVESTTAPAQYGTFTIAQDGTSDNWDWTYTLNPQKTATRNLMPGMHTETITLTITDMAAGTPNKTPHTIPISITINGTAPTVITEAPNADKAVAFNHATGATNDNLTAGGTLTITDGNGIASVVESTDAPAQYGTFAINRDGTSDNWNWTYTLNPQKTATRNLAPDTHTETITLTITDMAAGTPNTKTHTITVGITITGTAATGATAIDPSSDSDTEVTLDRYPALQPGGTANNDTAASGTLTITDVDGVGMVAFSESDVTYGTFTLTQDSNNSDNWDWTYTLNPDDTDTAALTGGEHTETIPITITDTAGTPNMETYNLEITINVIVNAAPTAVPVDQTVDEDATLTFAVPDVGFTDPNTGDGLASITILSLPDKGVLTLDGDPVAEDDVIMAADLAPSDGADGKLVYTPPDGLNRNDDTSFQITVQDMGGLESTAAEWTININAEDAPPDLDAKSTIAIEIGDGPLVLTRHQITYSDPDGGAEVDTSVAMLTLTQITGGRLERLNTTSNMWEELTAGPSGTFTQAQINDGHVRLISTSGGSFTISGVLNGNDLTPQTITFTGRTTEEIMATEIGLPEVNREDETENKKITTGIGKTKIKPGSGDDRVDGGLGDDEIDLSQGGEDTVVYRFETRGGKTIAWGGGDTITGFTPGEDRLLLDEIGGGGGG